MKDLEGQTTIEDIEDSDIALNEAFKAAFEETFDNTAESYETLWAATIECVVRELSIALEVLTHTDQRQFVVCGVEVPSKVLSYVGSAEELIALIDRLKD